MLAHESSCSEKFCCWGWLSVTPLSKWTEYHYWRLFKGPLCKITRRLLKVIWFLTLRMVLIHRRIYIKSVFAHSSFGLTSHIIITSPPDSPKTHVLWLMTCTCCTLNPFLRMAVTEWHMHEWNFFFHALSLVTIWPYDVRQRTIYKYKTLNFFLAVTVVMYSFLCHVIRIASA